ncbi:MAG: MBL fold metallo-hydrolase [Gemmatimonadetes bacterium]|nr:MBL fold metallo-hydrolase [Gemmatimonadota bacterium]
MFLKRFYDEKLAQASYLLGCGATGEAMVVDPGRDIQQYIDAAAAEGLQLSHVTETHIHADFVSGTNELVARTGARAYLSDEGGADWRYAFAEEIDAVLLRDGDEFHVGNVRVRALHTPGHTPEHMCFIFTDTAGADQPMGVFTGDFVFAGDVGRPDLLEKAAGVAGTMEAGARQLFESLKLLDALPEWIQLWPGHGAGSACGKSLGAVPSTTLGYEKLFNWAFSIETPAAFVAAVLAGQPEPPKYFAEMKRINREGPRVLGELAKPPREAPEALIHVLRDGGLIVDTRRWRDYRAGHAPGTLNIPLNRSFTTWAGWLIPYDRDVHLLVAAQDDASVGEAVRDLAKIGLDRITGYFTDDALSAWTAQGGTLERLDEISVEELRKRWDAGDVTLIDVRGVSEWQAGRIPGVANIPLGYLAGHIDELPRDRPVAVHCESGSRSAIATSLLAMHGLTNVVNVDGGFTQWSQAGHPVEGGVTEAAD